MSNDISLTGNGRDGGERRERGKVIKRRGKERVEREGGKGP